MRQATGDELLAKAEHARRLKLRTGSALIAVGLTVGGVGHFTTTGQTESALTSVGGVLCGVGLVLALWGRPGQAERAAAAAGSAVDEMQQKRADAMSILPLSVLILAALCAPAVRTVIAGDGSWREYARIAATVVFCFVPALMVAGLDVFGARRRMLDDELTRAFRRDALAWGYVALNLGFAGVFAAGLFDPPFGLSWAPLALGLASSTAGLRFAFLNRRAEAA